MSYTPDAHLVFSQNPAQDGRLVFGEGDAPQSVTATISLALVLPPLRIALAVDYDNRVQRGPSLARGAAWQAGSVAGFESVSRHGQAPRLSPAVQADWRDADRVDMAASMEHHALPHCANAMAGRWQRGESLGCRRLAAWVQLQHAEMRRAEAWQHGMAAGARIADAWRELDHAKRLSARSGWRKSARLDVLARDRAGVALPLPQVARSRWQIGIMPRPGRRWIEPVIPPVNPCYTPSARLVFRAAAAVDGRLVFTCDKSIDPAKPLKIIPIRRAYLVINEVTLIRVDNGRPLNCLALDIAVDSESWTCAWSAALAAQEFNGLRAERGEPVELLASINGHSYSLLTEGAPTRSRQFGEATVQIKGRGISAWLDDPYAEQATHSNAQDRMAQQLMAAALEINGVSMGWALDWQIADWLVPSGAWSYQGSPMAAALEIAASVGAIVQSSDTGKILRILPRYPVAPWAWANATPDIQIPLAIVSSDGVDPVIKPMYNAVYVSGQTQGVTGYIRRAGTAGDRLAPLVTHPLISQAEAARQRGLAILGDSGRQERIAMNLPLSDDTGLIQLNMLADVPDPDDAWRGLVRSVALSARWNDSTGLSVWQQIGLERHYAD